MCGSFMTPVIYNGGGPAVIQVDSAYLVHKDGSLSRMSVSIEDRTMDGMYGSARPATSYNEWTLPSTATREKLEDLQMEGIRQNEIRDEDVILGKGNKSHPGTRRYRQEGLERLRLPRVGDWKKKAAKEIVASVRGRPGRFLRKDQKRKGIYYDVGDEKAKSAADTMLKNFRDEEARKNAGDESS